MRLLDLNELPHRMKQNFYDLPLRHSDGSQTWLAGGSAGKNTYKNVSDNLREKLVALGELFRTKD
jgi:hypothetical protein